MVICPICKEKVYIQSDKLSAHGKNDALCYGSYMIATDCKRANSFIEDCISHLGYEILKKLTK